MESQVNAYQPQKAVIEKIIPETEGIKTFVLRPENPFSFHCGQFAELTVPRVGEAPSLHPPPALNPNGSNSPFRTRAI